MVFNYIILLIFIYIYIYFIFLYFIGPIPFYMADNAKKEFRRFLDNETEPLNVN